MSPEDTTWDVPTITITDSDGRQLDCYIEHVIEVEEQEYFLLHPVDSPIEIVTWPNTDDDDDDDDSPTVVTSEEVIKALFLTAKAVLAEENLSLKQSAVTLTVVGELPELAEEDDDGDDEGDDLEEFQWLASFFHEDQEYAVYTPLDPFFILARRGADGLPELLPPEEFDRIEALMPSIEDQFFDEL